MTRAHDERNIPRLLFVSKRETYAYARRVSGVVYQPPNGWVGAPFSQRLTLNPSTPCDAAAGWVGGRRR